MPPSDFELLQQFAREKSDAPFATLVARHLNLVYSAALRQVRSSQLAEDIAQSVFLDLSRSAHKLKPDTLLSAWLFQTTRRTAINVWRQESRRQIREQTAVELAAMNSPESEWTHIEPLLDEAMENLSRDDRDALLLRFFENKSLREVGEKFGVSEDAAQKRVSRAVEQLRQFFSRRGVTIGNASLLALLSANVVQAAPIGLGATISSALSVAAISGVAAKTLIMTTTQKILIATAAAAVVGTGVYEAVQNSDLRKQIQKLNQQQKPLADKVARLERERDDAATRLAMAQDEITRLRRDTAEIFKLRGDVTQLRTEGNDPSQKAAKTVAAKVKLLKQRLEQMPDKKIPELQFVTEKDWANAAWEADLDTEDGVREALSKLRETAVNVFLNEMMKAAFKKYLGANNGILPPDLFQLKSYFEVPVDDTMLQRYQLLQSGKPDNSADLVKLVAYADAEHDSNHGMSINGAWGGSFNKVQEEIAGAASDFAAGHNGQMPTDPAQIKPYLAVSTDEATIRKYLKRIVADPPPPEVVTITPVLKAYSKAHNGEEPKNPSDLLPYVTTPEQKAALQKLMQDNPASK